MARYDSASLLQLSRHGRPRNDLHRCDGLVRVSALARKTLQCALDALDSDARRAAPIYREHRRLDDRRAWPPALVDLRSHAYRAGHLAKGRRGQYMVHIDRLYGHVHFAGDPLALPRLSRD